jgi:hypothetical protein
MFCRKFPEASADGIFITAEPGIEGHGRRSRAGDEERSVREGDFGGEIACFAV